MITGAALDRNKNFTKPVEKLTNSFVDSSTFNSQNYKEKGVGFSDIPDLQPDEHHTHISKKIVGGIQHAYQTSSDSTSKSPSTVVKGVVCDECGKSDAFYRCEGCGGENVCVSCFNLIHLYDCERYLGEGTLHSHYTSGLVIKLISSSSSKMGSSNSSDESNYSRSVYPPFPRISHLEKEEIVMKEEEKEEMKQKNIKFQNPPSMMIL